MPFNFYNTAFTNVARMFWEMKASFGCRGLQVGPALWLSSLPNGDVFDGVVGVGVAICVIVLSMVCTNYLCCYAVYTIVVIFKIVPKIQDINRKWYSMKCIWPCNKTCATLAMASDAACRSWLCRLCLILLYHNSTFIFIPWHLVSTLFDKFCAVAFPLVVCNFTCSFSE